MPGKPSQCFFSLVRPAKRTAHLQSQCRYNSTSLKHPIDDELGDLGPIHHSTTQHKSFLARKDGESPNLPLPPSLDSIVLSQTNRWKAPKQRPNAATFTPFQKKLSENPYAHVLCSSPRQCRVTKILLPSALLLALHPRPHPTTNAPWLLPVSLTTSSPSLSQLGPSFRFPTHKYIAENLAKRRQWQRVLSERILTKLGREAYDKLVWREGMPEMITSLMREKLAEKLKWWTQQRGRLVEAKGPWQGHIEHIDDVSTVLYLKSLRTEADDLQARARNIMQECEVIVDKTIKVSSPYTDPHKKPGVTHGSPWWYREPLVPRLRPRVLYPELEFKTTLWRGKKVALYSLVDLLGEDLCAGLVKGSVFGDEVECLVVRSARHCVGLEMEIMALACWLAEPGP